MDLQAELPARSVYLNSDGTADGVASLNGTWAFAKGASVTLSGTALPSVDCWVTDVSPTTITLKKKSEGKTGGSDISAYTTAASALITQVFQVVDGVDGSQHLYQNRVPLELLNAPLFLLGTITSSGTAKNNHDTAVPFWDVNSALKELVITVIPDQACYVQVGTTNTVAATSSCEILQAGEKRTFCMGLSQGWISVLGVSGISVNVAVYRHLVE